MEQGSSQRVLVADDNKTALRFLELSLGKWGYEVISASDGNEAWKRFQEPDPPKLAILDWQMPGMDGVDVCRKVQQMDALIPPYIIMLTSRDQKEDILEGLGAGANDFVSKSCDKEVLRARLEVGRRAVEYQEALANSAKGENGNDLKEKEEMQKTILALKKRAVELEERLAEQTNGGKEEPSPEGSANILEEIVIVFKRGEINLPSPPQIGIKFKEMVNEGSNLSQIAGLLKQDAAISSKLIGISNSAFYRGLVENKTLDQAVGRLGLTTTKQYVDAVANRSLYYTKNENFKKVVESLWDHSLSCAYASQIVAQILRVKLSEDPFTLGLLHDIGRLVLIQAVGELQAKKKIGENIDNDDLASTIDTNHGRFGSALLKRWKFSNEFAQVAAYHDHLDEADTISKALLVVHFANLLVKSMGYGTSENEEIDLEEAESAHLLKVESSHIPDMKKQVEAHMDELKSFFS